MWQLPPLNWQSTTSTHFTMLWPNYIDLTSKNGNLTFPIIFYYYNIQAFIEDSHISHRTHVYWKCIDGPADRIQATQMSTFWEYLQIYLNMSTLIYLSCKQMVTRVGQLLRMKELCIRLERWLDTLIIICAWELDKNQWNIFILDLDNSWWRSLCWG